jgi:hypothetical protein
VTTNLSAVKPRRQPLHGLRVKMACHGRRASRW